MRTVSGLGWLVVVALIAPRARAQAVVEPMPESVPPPAWQTSDSGWLNRYTVARERLLAGDFAKARDLFAELVATATTGVDRAIAQEMELLARNWASRELMVVRRSDLGESSASAKIAGEPTTDEMAVLYTNSVIYGLGTGAWVRYGPSPKSSRRAFCRRSHWAGASRGPRPSPTRGGFFIMASPSRSSRACT
jgi:hypothetical protein